MFFSRKLVYTTLVVAGSLFTNFGIAGVFLNLVERKKLSGAKNGQKKVKFIDGICRTPECIRTANSILYNMDPNVSPCENFYRFACGGYAEKVILSEERPQADVHSSFRAKLENKLIKSIEGEMTDDDPQTFKLLQRYYNTCMDIDQIEQTSQRDFEEAVKAVGGWPVAEGDAWDESSFDWMKSTHKFRKAGLLFDMFLNIYVDVDSKNKSRHLLHLGRAKSLCSDVNLTYKMMEFYYDYMVVWALNFGADRDRAESEIGDALKFETQLIHILQSRKHRKVVMTVRELQSKHPTVPWTEYLNGLTNPNTGIHDDDEIVVEIPDSLEDIFELLTRTPKRVLANYAFCQIVFQCASQLSTLKGTVEESRAYQCFRCVSKNLNLATNALYVRRHFDDRDKTKAKEIVKDICDEYRHQLVQAHWMDEKTKAAALEKLDNTEFYVAYPDTIMDNEKLDKYHQHLKIDPESFLKNNLNASLFLTERSFDLLRNSNKTNWISMDRTIPDIVNASYRTKNNIILLSAGILQGNFFSRERPNYLNYGSIGTIIGHEMTHSLERGRGFDKEGNQVDWWDSKTEEKFSEKTKCFVEQYNNFTIQQLGINLNGERTLEENIADNGGIKLAYFAYNEWEKRNGQEPQLPGLPYTPQQMFWISAANGWCEKYRSEALRRKVSECRYSPGEFRINGSVSNMSEFSKDFNCSEESSMNPVRRCSVW